VGQTIGSMDASSTIRARRARAVRRADHAQAACRLRAAGFAREFFGGIWFKVFFERGPALTPAP
jgi:hypothetical protein